MGRSNPVEMPIQGQNEMCGPWTESLDCVRRAVGPLILIRRSANKKRLKNIAKFVKSHNTLERRRRNPRTNYAFFGLRPFVHRSLFPL